MLGYLELTWLCVTNTSAWRPTRLVAESHHVDALSIRRVYVVVLLRFAAQSLERCNCGLSPDVERNECVACDVPLHGSVIAAYADPSLVWLFVWIGVGNVCDKAQTTKARINGHSPASRTNAAVAIKFEKVRLVSQVGTKKFAEFAQYGCGGTAIELVEVLG